LGGAVGRFDDVVSALRVKRDLVERLQNVMAARVVNLSGREFL
jgi:hypothetical protein